MKIAITIFLTLIFHFSNSEQNFALKFFSKNSRESMTQNNKEIFPSVNLLTNIIQHSYENLLFVDHIPTQYMDYVTFNIDLNTKFTSQDSLYISGYNLLNTPIFINGEEPVSERKGKFNKLVKLDKFGKNTIYVSFISPDLKMITQRLPIYRLNTPSDIGNLKFAKNYYKRLINSDLFYNSFDLNLNSAVTRADIAYFIYKLKSPVNLSVTNLLFNDVPLNHWANDAITYVTEKRIMGEFPDGTFRPEQQMIKLELLLTLVRGLSLEVNYNNMASEFIDIDSKHWANKFINAALDYGLINLNKASFNIEQKIELKDFIEMTKDIQVVNERIQIYFNEHLNTEHVNNDEFVFFLSPTYEYLNSISNVDPFFIINYPENFETVYLTSVTVNGKIYPEKSFLINDNLITTNIRGEFEFVQNLHYGHNSFLIQAMGTTINYQLTSLKKYFDLDDHWVSDVASKMRFLNNVDDDDLFYPDRLLTLTDLVNFSEWLTVSTRNTFNEQIDFLTSNHVITMNNELDLEQSLSRINALVSILKLINLDSGYVMPTYNNQNPFWDISTDYWALPYLNLGVSLNIIAPSTKFFPDRTVTKAEFYTMLSRTPTVSKKIKQHFYD